VKALAEPVQDVVTATVRPDLHAGGTGAGHELRQLVVVVADLGLDAPGMRVPERVAK